MSYRKASLRKQMGAYVFKTPPLVIADHTLADVTSLSGSMTNFQTRGQITETLDTRMSANYMRGSSRLYDKLI